MTNNLELKSSAGWWPIIKQEYCDSGRSLIIYDPDGWDRKNYQFSWYEELITKDEFYNRVNRSTILVDIIK